MYTYVNFFVFVVVLHRYTALPYVRKPLIIEGFDCMPEDYPFLITIRRVDDRYICGGSLVEENWVLTAGHCCHQRNAEDLFVSAGLHMKYAINERALVKKIFIHPKFRRKVLENDICLILLKTPVHPNGKISYINLSYVEPKVELASSCFQSLILGFGNQSRISHEGVILEPNKVFDPRLKCAHLSVIPQSVCKMFVPVGSSHFCAMDFSSKQQDACIGDSGGPLICNNSQIGIISGGYGCGLPLVPSLFTRLDIFKDFISDTMNSNTGCTFKTTNIRLFIILLFFISDLPTYILELILL